MSRFFSLRFRLILLVLLAILPAAGLILYTAAHERQAVAEAARQGTLLLASHVSVQQDLLTESTRQLLAGLAHLPEVKGGDAEACSALFAALLAEHPLYANLVVTRPNGDLWCSAVPPDGPVNYADRAWFQEAVRTRRFVAGGYIMGRVTRRSMATFAYPLLDEAGQMQGVVATGLDLAWLNRYLAQTSLPEGAVLTVLDGQGTVLARTLEGEKWVGKTAPDVEIIQIVLAQRGPGTVEARGVDGVRRLYAFAPLAGNSRVLVGIPTAQVYGEADRMLRGNLIGLGIVTLLALAAAWLGGEAFLLRRVNALLAATRRMAGGDLSARTGIRYGMGELSQLARAFDEMAQSLQEQHQQRERAEADLRESQQHLAHLLAVSPAIIYTLNPDGLSSTWVSPNIATWLGYTPEEALQPGWWADHLHPEDREQALAQSTEVLVRGWLVHEYRFLKKNGESLWVQDELRLLRDEQGNPVEIVGAWTDITGRKQAEAQLAQQLQILTALYAGAQKLAEGLDLQAVALEAARTCVESFGVRLAWLGRAEADGRVTVLAQFPAEHPYPRQIVVRWDETPEGQGPTGRAIHRGFPVITNDCLADPHFAPWRPIAERYGFRSSAAFPLISRGHTFGTLNLYNDLPGFFTSERVDTFQALANQAAAALENARLYDDALRRLKRVQALRNIDMAITGSLDPRVTLRVLLDEITMQLSVDAAAVLLFNPDTLTLEYAAGRGFHNDITQHPRLQLGEGYAGRAALERRSLGISDLTRAQDFVQTLLLREEGFAAYYAAPLIAKERVLGVLETFHRTRRDFDGEWLEFLEALAGQVALALENAGLHQELQEYTRELERRVAQRTAELEAANEQLRQAHQEVSRALERERELNELKTRFVSMVSHEFRSPLTAIFSSAELLEHYGPRWPEEKKLTHLQRIRDTVQRMLGLLDDVLVISRAEAGRLAFEPKPLDLIPFCRSLVEEFQLGIGKQHRLILDLTGLKDPESLPAVMDEQLLYHILANLLCNAIKYSPAGSQVRLALRRWEERVVFEVEDHGIGIPAADQARLFEPFHRAGNVGSTPGTGLGLSIVKRMVDLHGGAITVQSEVDKGTTATVELPTAP